MATLSTNTENSITSHANITNIPRSPPSLVDKASLPVLSLLTTRVNDIPYLVWMFKSSTSNALFASFFDVSTGIVTTKRLSRRWQNPPVQAQDREQWFQDNIGSVLLKQRGPEDTPRRPPSRAPPSCMGGGGGDDGNNSWISEGMSGIFPSRRSSMASSFNQSISSSSQSPEIARLNKRVREQDDEIQSLRATTTTTTSTISEQDMKRVKQQGFEDAMIEADKTLRLMRQDLNDAHRRRIETEAMAEAKVREAECILQECEELMSNKNEDIAQLKHKCDGLGREKVELETQIKVMADELTKAKGDLVTKQALVDELTTYVGELLAKRG